MKSVNTSHIVICRYKENLDWLLKISYGIDIKIYNKGLKNIEHLFKVPNIEVNQIQNIGTESFVYLKYIIDNYPNFPDVVIFSQGNPFDHSPNFVEIVNNLIPYFQEIQPLTKWYKKNIPPYYITNISKQYLSLENYPIHVDFYDNELSLIIQDKILYKDHHRGRVCLANHLNKFFSDNNIRDNIMRHIGIIPRSFNNKNITPMCYGAIFAVDRHKILSHSKNKYIELMELLLKDRKIFGYIMEYSWLEFFLYDPPKELYI